jgi:hypothetical protein
MRILLRKISDQQHELAIVRESGARESGARESGARESGARESGARESVVCETRSYLKHDLLHYAVEAEAGIEGGLWGSLARGRTLAEMNDRARMAPGGDAGEIATVETFVGVLSGAAKGLDTAEVMSVVERAVAATSDAAPAWLTEPFVAAVQARLRGLLGAWKATPYGGTMTLHWKP